MGYIINSANSEFYQLSFNCIFPIPRMGFPFLFYLADGWARATPAKFPYSKGRVHKSGRGVVERPGPERANGLGLDSDGPTGFKYWVKI